MHPEYIPKSDDVCARKEGQEFLLARDYQVWFALLEMMCGLCYCGRKQICGLVDESLSISYGNPFFSVFIVFLFVKDCKNTHKMLNNKNTDGIYLLYIR